MYQRFQTEGTFCKWIKCWLLPFLFFFRRILRVFCEQPWVITGLSQAKEDGQHRSIVLQHITPQIKVLELGLGSFVDRLIEFSLLLAELELNKLVKNNRSKE
jgi:hypothetical protein